MIVRDPQAVARSSYDLVIVGGGAYGIALTLEAARRGLRPLLVERRDFGGETSWNSLRIVHGGLRYLQSLDLKRFRESIIERRWWLENFPDLVEPLACLMPLYGNGLRRPIIFRFAFLLEGLLSFDRNRNLAPQRKIPWGSVLQADEVLRAIPRATRQGLAGGALWHDAAMPDSQRLLIEMLHWATACGAETLNYVEATGLRLDKRRVVGIVGRDTVSGEAIEIGASVVVNCAGPWCREVAATLDRDIPELFHPSVAFNVLLDREPLFDGALAVEPPRPGSRTYFLQSFKGRILAGTYHAEWSRAQEWSEERIRQELVSRLLEDLNEAIPGFHLQPTEALRLHWGFLPAEQPRSVDLASREVIRQHGSFGGPHGLWSVSGVKFTTCRAVAEKTLRQIHARSGKNVPPIAGVRRPPGRAIKSWAEVESLVGLQPKLACDFVRRQVTDEAVVQIEDLMLRRTDWGFEPEHLQNRVEAVTRLLRSDSDTTHGIQGPPLEGPRPDPARSPSWPGDS